MEELDQILSEWMTIFKDPEPSQILLHKHQNKTIMNTFINYETKINQARKTSMIALSMILGTFLTALLFYTTRYYIVGEETGYNIVEMVLGFFLILFSLTIIFYTVFNLRFPNINDLATADYLEQLKKQLKAWQSREIPAVIVYCLCLPAGMALVLKSVFGLQFIHIFLPFCLLYCLYAMISYVRHNPEFLAVLKEIEARQKELVD